MNATKKLQKVTRNTLITHNLRLVVYIAKKFESSGVAIDDLISIGTIGLIKAVKTFCPETCLHVKKPAAITAAGHPTKWDQQYKPIGPEKENRTKPPI